MYANLCRKLWVTADNVRQDERGVTSIEYAVLAGLIIVALVLAFGPSGFFGSMFTTLGDKITNAMNGS